MNIHIHYLLLLVIMAITFIIYEKNQSDNNKKLCIILVTIILTFFTGLRSWHLGDLNNYLTDFMNCSGEDWKNAVFVNYTNIGIRLLFRLVSYFGGNYGTCLLIISFINAASLGYIIYKYSPSPYWSYLIYISMGFYIFTYTGLKQTLAMSFLMFAMDGILESNFKRFLLWTFIAGMFHAPAFIFLPAYAFAGLKINHAYFVIMFLTALFVYVFQANILSFMTDAYYDEEATYVASEVVGGRLLMMIFILCVAWFLRPPHNGDTIYRKVFSIMVIAIIIQYFSIYDNVFTRLADYYYQFVILLFPLMMETADHQLKTNPKLDYTVRVHQDYVYTFLAIGITLFALWYYYPQVYSSGIISTYKFYWDMDLFKQEASF